MTVDQRRRQPRYHEVATTLREAIGEGRYAVGALLPTESDLTETFAVSRHTVREALRQLTDLGLVKRRQGSGTQVVAQRPVVGYTQSLGSIGDLLQYASSTYLRVDSIEDMHMDRDLAEMLGCPPNRFWRKLVGRRYEPDGGPAICVSEVYLDPSVGHVADGLERTTGSLYQLIERRGGEPLSEVSQDIAAITVTGERAATLEVDAGSAALRLVRRYIGTSGRIMMVADNLHPAGRFTYTMRIRREAPA